MRSSSQGHVRTAPPPAPPVGRLALLINAELFRRCAAAGHERLSGTTVSPSRVNIDGAGISRWLEDAPRELGLPATTAAAVKRSSRRVHDTFSGTRGARLRQRHYHGVLRAEGLVVTCTRRSRISIERSLASDLVSLARHDQVDTVLLIAGDHACAQAVTEVRGHGIEVIVLVPPASAALVTEPLRLAASRVIGLHPEVFESMRHIRAAD